MMLLSQLLFRLFIGSFDIKAMGTWKGNRIYNSRRKFLNGRSEKMRFGFSPFS